MQHPRAAPTFLCLPDLVSGIPIWRESLVFAPDSPTARLHENESPGIPLRRLPMFCACSSLEETRLSSSIRATSALLPLPAVAHEKALCARLVGEIRLRPIDHLQLVMEEVLSRQRLDHLAALVVEALQLSRLVFGQGVVREKRHSDSGVGVADHGIRQTVRVHFAPTHRFARRGAAQAAGIGTRIGHLEEVVLADTL